jgi:hypothetical protein
VKADRGDWGREQDNDILSYSKGGLLYKKGGLHEHIHSIWSIKILNGCGGVCYFELL